MDVNTYQDWIDRIKPRADAAPSILDTKPWLFTWKSRECIELEPDWSKHLNLIDPWHRELVISCGAALFNVRMAIRAAGHDAVVWPLPDEVLPGRELPGRVVPSTEKCPHCGHYCGVRGLLASVEIVTHRHNPPTLTEQRLYEAILERHTIREPFNRRMWMNVVTELERAARVEKVDARLLHPREAKRWLRQTARAEESLRANPQYNALLSRAHVGGIGPRPAHSRLSPVRDFGHWDGQARFEKRSWLIVLETTSDTPSAWLRIGEGLQRLLLTARFYDVQASFLTQRLEVFDEQNQTIEPAEEPWQPRPRYAQMVIRVGHAKEPNGKQGTSLTGAER